jgi:hypothetical protein
VINRLFQEQDKVTVEDLLEVVRTREKLYSHAFNRAIVKLVRKPRQQFAGVSGRARLCARRQPLQVYLHPSATHLMGHAGCTAFSLLAMARG